MSYDVAAIRRDFPILDVKVHGKPLVYLDNAATTQKPKVVLDAERHYYEHENSNVHRGVHHLSETATKHYEGSRKQVQKFIGAKHAEEIIYTRGATEALNLVANTIGRMKVNAGDEVLVTGMEHHSNIVPWQMLCDAKGAKLQHVPITDSGELDMAAFDRLLSRKTKVLAFTHVSNALGTINPVGVMTKQAHEKGAIVVVDGAQAVPHTAVDVQKLGVDFYAASGHKMYGPTGIGFLWGRKDLLEVMPPWQGGGDMIRSVSFEGSTWNDLPWKFEAGTPHIAGGIGLGVAAEYLLKLGLDNVAAHEHKLLEYATQQVAHIPGLKVIGTAPHKAAVLSFTVEGVHPHDIGSLLDRDGVAVRTGHHCAQPVMDRYGIPATSRASFGCYNTKAEVDVFVESLTKLVKLFA